MADTKISAMTAAGTLDGTELVPVVKSAANRQTTASAIAALSGITALTGDGTASGVGSQPLILATVNSNVGSFSSPTITVNAKGLITAASAGAAAANYHPGFASGRWYTRRLIQGLSVSFTGTANRIYAVPFFVPVQTTFTKMTTRVQTGVASSHAQLAVYNNSNGLPGSLKQNGGEVSTAAAGQQDITGLSIALAPGWYWLAVGISAAVVLYSSTGSGNDGLTDMLGFPSTIPTTGGLNGVVGTWTYSSGNPPDPFPTATELSGTSNVPLAFIGL